MTGWPIPQLRGRVAVREAEIEALHERLRMAMGALEEIVLMNDYDLDNQAYAEAAYRIALAVTDRLGWQS